MPLISVRDLAAIVDRDDVVVFDCRWALADADHGRTSYTEGHIPGAVFADLDTDLSGSDGPGRHPLPDPETFDAFLGRNGVTPSTSVVAYDDLGGAIAARLWWMLTDQGHEAAFVLDGGIQAWTDAGLSLSVGSEPRRGQRPAGVATSPWTGIVDREAVAERADSVLLVDSRAAERYRGDVEPVDPKAGHIPGAINLPHGTAVAARFLDPASQKLRWTEIGADESSEVIVHCGSGVTACRNILSAELAGLPRPLLYVGSWSDWSSSDLPITTGDHP